MLISPLKGFQSLVKSIKYYVFSIEEVNDLSTVSLI